MLNLKVSKYGIRKKKTEKYNQGKINGTATLASPFSPFLSMLRGFSLLLTSAAINPNPALKNGGRGRYSKRCTINLFPRFPPPHPDTPPEKKSPRKISPGNKTLEKISLETFATFDTFNHHDLRFPSLFLYMILGMNYKQHVI